uniref:Phospholipase A2 n=1 Tax=Bos mutus grunniens TaxID=30521 RepID=A0A8B9WIN2_BOSMU
MKTLLLLAVIMAIGLLQVHGGLLNFRKMIQFTTGKESVTSYRRYGCYCGTRGRGTPKDATDWCCRAHDCCYRNLESRGCRTKFLKYNVTYQEDQIVCGKNQADNSQPPWLIFSSGHSAEPKGRYTGTVSLPQESHSGLGSKESQHTTR